MGTRAISSIDACFVLGRSIPFGTGLTIQHRLTIVENLFILIVFFLLQVSDSDLVQKADHLVHLPFFV